MIPLPHMGRHLVRPNTLEDCPPTLKFTNAWPHYGTTDNDREHYSRRDGTRGKPKVQISRIENHNDDRISRIKNHDGNVIRS
jgi:hypothetical protein